MANSVKASCGHYVWAFGADGSIARKQCESQPCAKCLAREVKAIVDNAGWSAVYAHPVYGPIVARNRREDQKTIDAILDSLDV